VGAKAISPSAADPKRKNLLLRCFLWLVSELGDVWDSQV
jgi:hypothetical protein